MTIMLLSLLTAAYMKSSKEGQNQHKVVEYVPFLSAPLVNAYRDYSHKRHGVYFFTNFKLWRLFKGGAYSRTARIFKEKKQNDF